MLDQYLDDALRATARQDFESAIEAYREIEDFYIQSGNSETAITTDAIIESLERLMEEAK